MNMSSQPVVLRSSVGRALGLESRVSWVQIPPEAAGFSLEKSSSGVIELSCCLESVPKFVYHVYT